MASVTTKAKTEATETDPYLEREARIAALRDKLREREEGTAEAEGAAAAVIGGLKRGIDTYTAADLAAAKVETERAGYLLAAAKAVYDRAVKAGPYRPIVAAELADKIGKALDLSVLTAPTLPGDTGSGRTAWLVQTSATEAKPDGGMAATVQVSVYRDSIHRDTDWDLLGAALSPNGGMGAPITVASRPSRTLSDGRAIDTALITVNWLLPQITLPFLPGHGLAEFAAKSVMGNIVRPATLALGERDVRVVVEESIGGKVYESEKRPMAKSSVTILHTNQTTEADLVVSTISARLTLSAGDEMLQVPGERFAAPLEEATKAAKGTTYGYAGRLVGVKVSNRTTGARSASVEATFTFHGQVA